MFARRLQVQERLTAEIADAVVRTLEPRGVAVVTEASHLCMMMRGVQKQGSSTCILTTRGVFRDDAQLRQEVLAAVQQ
jgi:GTP cyclohydrolase I